MVQDLDGVGNKFQLQQISPCHHSIKRTTMSNELQVRNIWQIQPTSEENASKAQPVCNKNKLPSTQLIMELALVGNGFSSFFGFAAVSVTGSTREGHH